jgi:hypothetical protein
MTSENAAPAICPQPKVWHEVSERLLGLWRTVGSPPADKPPVPLILAGWAYSSNLEKWTRWRETVSWAERHGIVDLASTIPPEQWYRV